MASLSVKRNRANQHVILFAKPPLMGLSKTRLAKDIGPTHAARMARFMARKTVRTVYPDPRWRTHLFLTPDKYIGNEWGWIWPRAIARFSQGNGDLGKRLERAASSLLSGRLVIIGTDTPDLSRSHIHRAFNALITHDLVIGPSTDGGFYLIGVKPIRMVPNIFRNVRWSSEFTLSDLISNLPANHRVKRLEPLLDIDTGEDYRLWLQNRPH